MEIAEQPYFVDRHSVVRQIWGKSDTILLIFAGASAEFALNKAVDWLYFTGRLPADPIGRLFTTVSYARAIVFSERQSALRAIDAMTTIHTTVEANRDAKIPEWAYRDVLFLLIDYSIRAFELLERKLTTDEKHEVVKVFHKIGCRMGLHGLPETLKVWEKMRQDHLNRNLQHSAYTDDLFKQYRKHLGWVRFRILVNVQMLVVPNTVRTLLRFRNIPIVHALLAFYKASRILRVDGLVRSVLLPANYKNQIQALDVH
jgi:uncharacterized protein (DUF2236 family)